ncbi:MAG: hypothetical protein GEV06_24525 [Luteitalea sp.]|nr:hypothetical protein [Luteitalea sp.]
MSDNLERVPPQLASRRPIGGQAISSANPSAGSTRGRWTCCCVESTTRTSAVRLQLRRELFDVFNQPLFADPVAWFNSKLFRGRRGCSVEAGDWGTGLGSARGQILS